MSAHARLAPSAAHRWIRCPGSVRLSQGVAGATSEYAALGTAAHKLLEQVLLLGVDPDEWLGHKIVVPTEGGSQMVFEVDTDMTGAVGLAADYVHSYEARNPGARVHLERRVHPGRLFQREDCWGTLDISIHNPPELVIADYKHGAGVYVDAENNEQLLTYAVGEIADCLARAPLIPFETVRLVVIQPRHASAEGPVRDHVVPIIKVRQFAETLLQAAQRTDEPEPELHAGDHCHFCKAAAQCPELARHVRAVAQEEFNEENLRLVPIGSEQFSHLLRQVPVVESWCSAVSAAAQHYLESGGQIPGFKLVAGRQARFWRDEAAARQRMLFAGFAEDAVAPRSVVSVAQAEKLFKKERRGKEFKTDFAPLVGQTRGSPTIADSTDPRPAVNPLAAQFENLDNEELLA